MRAKTRLTWRWILAAFFILAGANHFLNPAPYLSMMPPSLPAPALLVIVSGIAEILGGIGLLFTRTCRASGWGLIALLLAVFPANLHVALHGWPGVNLPSWALWGRLPLQAVFIWWAYQVCVTPPTEEITARV